MQIANVKSWTNTAGVVFLTGSLLWLLTACTVEPEPLAEAALAKQTNDDLTMIRATRFVPDKPITLYEAMARAVTFNLEHRVREIEGEIAEAELEQANYRLLPAFDTGAGTDRQNRATSRTSDRNQRSANAGLAWNILDLGVSYARAKQQANRVLIAKERRRKAHNDILRDVRLAYWRAASAGQLLRSASSLSGQIQLAVRYSSELEASQVRNAKVSIAYRRALLDSVRHMVAFRREISDAKAQLAELLNIPPGVSFDLAEPEKVYVVPSIPIPVSTMERQALLQRAEIRNEEYQKRVDDWRMREQLYDLLPGIDFNLGGNYSSDSFLLNNTWTSSGIQLGMNLFNLFSIPGRLEAREHGKALADSRRMAMAIAVMAQVHISYRQYQDAVYQFALTRRIADADRNLTGLAKQEAQLASGGFLEAIEAGAREMRTGMEEHRAYVDLVRSHNELMHAVGVNSVEEPPAGTDIAVLASNLERQYSKWDQATDVADRLVNAPLEALIEAALPSAEVSVAEAAVNEPANGIAAQVVEQPAAVERAAVEIAEIAIPEEFPSFREPVDDLKDSVALSKPDSGDAEPADTATAQVISPPLPSQRRRRDSTLPLNHFVAQVGVFSQAYRADKVIERLLAQSELRGIADLVHLDTLSSRKHDALYAVRIGPFFARQDAKGLCERIKKHKLDCVALLQKQMSLAFAVGRY